jgi:predicted 3-demethylubiquinone-9 3-methyltransferase (glyoxalase superfamily)
MAQALFKFNEAISFVVHCDSQEEIDYYWEKLSAGRRRNSAAG